MTCPKCGKNALVIDSRETEHYRRRRYACACGNRFSTIEITELNSYTLTACSELMNNNRKFKKIIQLAYLKMFEPETYRNIRIGAKKNEN